jgi:uncharacterized membrane protein YbaN (DUF454 family)
MRKQIKSSINYLLIILLVLLGILGLVLPIVPGLVFIAIALIILSIEMPFINDKIEKHLKREHPLGKVFYSIRDRVEKYFK